MAKAGAMAQEMGLVGPTTYDREPTRHPDLKINSKEPFNAEPLGPPLVSAYITPEAMYYKRNHGPIPVLDDPATWALEVGGLLPRPLHLTLAELRAMPQHTVVATLQCAGNRRTEMSRIRKVRGVGWGMGVVGNAQWTGVLLADVLRLAGVSSGSMATPQGGRHVEFISVDVCPEEKGGEYRASVPLEHATSSQAEVLLAYDMNGHELGRDHGFPLRVVVPGVIGARSVKWLRSVILRVDECQGFFMQRDYKMFPPSVDWHNVDWSTRRPIMDFPVQCAICEPVDGASLHSGAPLTIAGYALVGGGRGIERVDVSLDSGSSWLEARRLPQSGGKEYDADDPLRDKWAWVLWELNIPVLNSSLAEPLEVVAKAVDSAGNVQPEKVDQIWNLRGVLNNSWHRIRVVVSPRPTSSSL